MSLSTYGFHRDGRDCRLGISSRIVLRGTVVGMIDIRHSLATDFLAQYGGHIGYCIRPMERRLGYATQMLALGLEKCREFGVPSVHIGCYASNEASIRTIKANGDILVEEKPRLDVIFMNVYSITL